MERLEQNYFAVNLLYTLAILPIIAVTYQIGQCTQRERKYAGAMTKVPLNAEETQGAQLANASETMDNSSIREKEYEMEIDC